MTRHFCSLLVFVAATAMARAQSLYSEDFSNGAPGWAIVSPLCCGVTWKADALPAGTPNGPHHSAPASLNINNDIDYEGGSGTAYAESPPIDLSVATGTPVLTFWCNDQMSEGLCDPHERTLVSITGQTSWRLGFDPDFYCDISCPQFTWHPHSVPLQASWGVVRIRFEMRSDGLFDSTPGWFVDDISVFDAPAPTTYCTGKQTFHGCTPDTAWGGALPSVSDPASCTLACSGVVANKNGMFFYGLSGPASLPFLGGTLCIASPIKRTFVQASGGTHSCSGYYAIDFNAWIQSGSDPALVAGQAVHGQWWFRDPNSSFDSGLSNALALSVQS